MESSMPFFLIHPLSRIFLQLLLSALVLGFTHPTSTIRLVAFPLQCLFVLLTFVPPIPVFDSSRVFSNIYGVATVCCFLQYIDAGLLSRWSFDARGPTSANGGMLHIVKRDHNSSCGGKTSDHTKRDLLARLRFGIWIGIPWNPRLIHTPWQVTGTPDFPAGRIPSRAEFLCKAVLRLVAYFLFADLVTTMGSRDASMAKRNQKLFDGSRVPFFARLGSTNGEEVMIRFGATLFFGLTTYVSVQIFHTVAQIVAVGSGLSGVEGWKPMYGSLTDCWSIRQFWGSVVFDHIVNAKSVCISILRSSHFLILAS
jgi:hypothetical protein